MEATQAETTLWGTRIGNESWQEELITSTTDAQRIKDASAWATANGFDRLRASTFDGVSKPNFAGSVR